MDQWILRFFQEQAAQHEEHAHEQRLGKRAFFDEKAEQAAADEHSCVGGHIVEDMEDIGGNERKMV